jgi:hypothetical protein
MIRHLSVYVYLAFVSAATPSLAANRPQAGMDSQKIKVWTNDDLEKLHDGGLISVVGQVEEETSISEFAPRDHEITKDPEWYAEQAAALGNELERRQAQLREYRQALDDARSLREMTGGINLAEGDIGITPEAGIEILQRQVNEAQTELDALGDLARRNDIPPGTLRGQ